MEQERQRSKCKKEERDKGAIETSARETEVGKRERSKTEKGARQTEKQK